MTKLRYALIPACICFGPLFMTRMGGTLEHELAWVVSMAGTLMLTIGLNLMFGLIMEEKLGESVRPTEKPQP